MINAKEEFLDEIRGKARVKAAVVRREIDFEEYVAYTLHVGDDLNQLEDFLSMLDFDYDNGYGGQEVSGFIWYEDGTWSERGEYDGSEWWEYKECPDIATTMEQLEEA